MHNKQQHRTVCSVAFLCIRYANTNSHSTNYRCAGRYTKSMKYISLILLLIYSAFIHAEEDFLEMMVQGKYLIVGKAIDSEKTYFGKLSIFKDKGTLQVIRTIDDRQVSGNASIESAIGGDAKVLRIRFKEQEKSYEETCMVSSDLDNNARISCYLYQPNIKTNDPGFEVFYNDHTVK